MPKTGDPGLTAILLGSTHTHTHTNTRKVKGRIPEYIKFSVTLVRWQKQNKTGEPSAP